MSTYVSFDCIHSFVRGSFVCLFVLCFLFIFLFIYFLCADEDEKAYWEKINADRITRFNSKREKKRGTEKVGTGTVLSHPIILRFIYSARLSFFLCL